MACNVANSWALAKNASASASVAAFSAWLSNLLKVSSIWAPEVCVISSCPQGYDNLGRCPQGVPGLR